MKKHEWIDQNIEEQPGESKWSETIRYNKDGTLWLCMIEYYEKEIRPGIKVTKLVPKPEEQQIEWIRKAEKEDFERLHLNQPRKKL